MKMWLCLDSMRFHWKVDIFYFPVKVLACCEIEGNNLGKIREKRASIVLLFHGKSTNFMLFKHVKTLQLLMKMRVTESWKFCAVQTCEVTRCTFPKQHKICASMNS
ncbi:hypothetical protein L1049_005409 [Liquidambar formosana]|uniref:Uncharacterized protein n=1 Tax=Liquidambar formosana TaxID=63359 RepID=A0AAP0X1Q2_LIQFO